MFVSSLNYGFVICCLFGKKCIDFTHTVAIGTVKESGVYLITSKFLRVTVCKTDTPEIHDPPDFLDFWHMCLL